VLANVMFPLLKPKQDFVFKNIFGVENYEPVLVSFLNSLFKGNPYIKSITLKNTEQIKETEGGKISRLDVKAVTDNGVWLDVEIQCKDTGEIPARAIHSISRMQTDQLHAGKSYNDAKAIGVWIMADENLFDDCDDPVTECCWARRSRGWRDSEYRVLDDVQRLFFIELQKFAPNKADEHDLLNVWLTFLKDPSSLPQEALKIEEVHKAFDRLVFVSGDEKMRLEAQARQDAINDYYSATATAERIGEAKGEAKKARETAIAMLSRGLDVSIIRDCTGLSTEEINSISKI
jgi:predicted transposase/invertase (TIGR01784 family)